jgi:hypothetical protein
MKAPHTIEREIEVVETIIGQLKSCLKIYYQARMHEEFFSTLKDIRTCKTELKKLIAKRNSVQGEAKDGAKIQ